MSLLLPLITQKLLTSTPFAVGQTVTSEFDETPDDDAHDGGFCMEKGDEYVVLAVIPCADKLHPVLVLFDKKTYTVFTRLAVWNDGTDLVFLVFPSIHIYTIPERQNMLNEYKSKLDEYIDARTNNPDLSF